MTSGTTPTTAFAESKPEVLLLAALDYSRSGSSSTPRRRPPRAIFHQIAARLDRKILHLPLGTLSPATLRKIRVMHVLSGHDNARNRQGLPSGSCRKRLARRTMEGAV